ncbi:MAG: hypothetical protein R3Y35_12915 [Clostridia bacterium]
MPINTKKLNFKYLKNAHDIIIIKIAKLTFIINCIKLHIKVPSNTLITEICFKQSNIAPTANKDICIANFENKDLTFSLLSEIYIPIKKEIACSAQIDEPTKKIKTLDKNIIMYL